MACWEIPIQHYEVLLGREIAAPINCDATITCRGMGSSSDPEDSRIEVSRPRITGLSLTIVFMSPGHELPANTVTGQLRPKLPVPKTPKHDYSTISATIYARADQYPWFLDALRNEKCSAKVLCDDGPLSLNSIIFEGNVGWGHDEL